MPIDYYVILDFEATCDDKNAPQPQEVIEFPSVLLDAKNLVVIDSFREYVKPYHHPKLRDFCTELTGIRQHQVDKAEKFPTVLENHQNWLKSHNLDLNQSTKDHTWIFVLCGDWDLGTMLPLQLGACEQPIKTIPECYRRWINVKKPFSTYLNKRATGMAGMLNELALTLDGRHHSGLDDCKNIAKIVIELAKIEPLKMTTQTALSRYPPINVEFIFNGEAKKAELKKRALASILGNASGLFRTQIKHAEVDGKELVDDDDARPLEDGVKINLS